METVEFPDDGGGVQKLKKYDGELFPHYVQGNVKDFLDELSNIEIRNDDVMVISYPKSGTHWLYDIVRMIQTGKDEVNERMKSIELNPMQPILDQPSPRCLQSHFPFKYLPKGIKEGGKIIYITRNPKDVAVSLYEYAKKLALHRIPFRGSFENLLEFVFYESKSQFGNWFKFVLDWEKDIQRQKEKGCEILHVQYEELQNNLKANIYKIAEFLEIKRSNDLLDRIAENCTYSNMKGKKDSDPNFKYACYTLDGMSPLFRKGKVGDWKTKFTVAESEEFDRIYAERMKDSKLKFTFTL